MFVRVDGVQGPPSLSSGTMLDDKYRIERLIALGGMGAVYLGTHTKLRKRVAIKVLNPQHSTAAMIERFHREAITASQIGHEGIAQVTDLGTTSDGEPFLVMEYLEGESLAARLRSTGPLCVEDACELCCAILAPLAAAHRAGIVHRDLKPDNVFLVRQSRGETIKLLDFGISRVPGLDAESRLTDTGLVLGTPFYMSPEQARGESRITPAADLYAMGVMLYEMLVGDVPIRADNYNALMYRVTMGDFAPPRERRPDLPVALERIILDAMTQLPDLRPGTAELEQALLAFCRPGFRDHANGRISAPAVPTSAPPRTPPSGAPSVRVSVDRSLFTGSTISDTVPDDLGLPPDVAPSSGVRDRRGPSAVLEPAAYAEGSQPALAHHATMVDGSAGSRPALGAQGLAAQGTGVYDPRPASAAPRSRASRVVLTLAIAAVASAAGFLVYSVAGSDEPAITGARPATSREAQTASPAAPPLTQPRAQAAQPAAQAAQVAPRPSTAPATITVRLAIEPASAAISLDGARVLGSELVVARDGGAHRLRISAPGYAGYDQAVWFEDGQTVVVHLKRAIPPARGKEPAPGNTGPDPKSEPNRRFVNQSPYQQ